MKYILRIIFSFTLILCAMGAKAERYFDNLSSSPDFNYTYISPYMLKAMNGNIKTGQELTLSVDCLNEVEIISTYTSGTNKEFWQAIRDVIKKFDLKTLSTTKNNYNRSDILGRLNSSNNLSYLMLINQTGGKWVSVTFITGDIPLSYLKTNF